jgi:hypothetical protein
MTVHYLKTWPEFYEPLVADKKRCELRRNDRDYKVGDQLNLQEWDPKTGSGTGRFVIRRITHVLRHWEAATLTNESSPLDVDWVILSLDFP